MAQFLFLFRGGDPREMGTSLEEMQRHMERWHRWSEELKEAGIWRAGEPLENSGQVVRSDGVVSDGPFAESKEIVGGFVVIEAASLDAASELAKGCPIYEANGFVEVRPIASDGLCANETAIHEDAAPARAT